MSGIINKKYTKKRKRKPKPIVGPPQKRFKSHPEARQVIQEFHRLQKCKEQIKNNTNFSDLVKKSEEESVELKIELLGGVKRYQEASLFGEERKKYNTSKWVLSKLQENGIVPKSNYQLKVLDVGALNNHYKGIPWMDLTAIDINPQDKSVLKIDFFDLPPPSHPYDVIILSLVINCIGDISKRGLMLQRCQQFLKMKSGENWGGILFVIFPLACTKNSRYLNHELFVEMLSALGFDVIAQKTSPKLAFYMFEQKNKCSLQKKFKKVILRNSGGHNNFCIVLE